MTKKWTAKKITTLALLCAMASICSVLIRIPLVPAVPWLSYDGKDVILAIGAFLYGPLDALIVTTITAFIEILFKGGNLIDVLMNIISSGLYVCVAAYVYKKLHTKNGAFIGMLSGLAASTFGMLIWNYIMTPIYFGMPRSAVVALLPAIGLFNIIKGSITTAITLFVYKPVVTALRKAGMVPQSHGAKGSMKSWIGAGAFAAVTVIIAVLAYSGIIGA